MDFGRLTSNVSILIPAYGEAERLHVCLKSLSRYAPATSQIFVLDDGTPDRSVADCCHSQNMQNLTYVRSEVNRGFVSTCNWGWSQIAPVHSDILLLNSDTEVTAGFLEEMIRVLYLDERHGAVTPRSNNATLFSIPLGASNISPDESYRIWQEIKEDLPAYRIMPTIVGFCVLVKAIILERFGLFDEIYSPGYNEENDFACRINRYGFSAVAANHAFVYHYESSTFGSRRKDLDKEHRKTLLERYPEYERKVSDYLDLEVDPIETFSILVSRRRPALLFDLFHLPAKHSGTSEFALNLLREVHTQLSDECDFFVGISEEGRFFASELNGYRLFENRPSSEMLFDLAFKPSQIFTWTEFRRMNRLAPRLSFVLQDIIAARCDYLASLELKTIFRKSIELVDRVYTISESSYADFKAFFNVDFSATVIHHGTNLGLTAPEAVRGEYVLLMGNRYVHKGVAESLDHLMDVGPVRVLGGDAPQTYLPSHIHWFASGNLTRGHVRELFAKASVLVYPSHYEGYGLPIVDALASGKQVVALDNEVNRELAASLGNPNLTLIRSLRDLRTVVRSKLRKSSEDPIVVPSNTRRWKEVAKDYVSGLRDLLAQRPDIRKIRARSELFQLLSAARHS